MKGILTTLAVAFCFTGFAQNNQWEQMQFDLTDAEGAREGESVNYCGHNHLRDHLIDEVPGFEQQYTQDRNNLESFTRDFIEHQYDQSQAQRGGNYIIPVVFHVVHQYGVENISDEQIYDALRILNDDYQLGNTDTSFVVSSFKSVIANVGVEFRLAQRDPQGNCHPGITRTVAASTYDGDYDMVGDIQDVHGAWASNRYLNVFVCSNAAGAAGYTQLPGNWPPANSGYAGIWLGHNYVGSIGTGSPNRSRALTHEVGHWLNLSHCWGPNNNPGNSASCSDDDQVSDTPNTIGWQSCNLTGTTCNSLDNVQNYMEYSYCSRMFTEGQKQRMVTALNSGTGGRSNLWTTNNLNFTGVSNTPSLCETDFTITNTVICVGDTVQFTDATYNAATTWDWTFQGGAPATSTTQDPFVSYSTPGVYDVTLTASDGSTSDTKNRTQYITVLPSVGTYGPVSEGFEAGGTIPNATWFQDNPDGGNTWQITNSAAYDGDYSIKMTNFNNTDGAKDYFDSRTHDLYLASAASITFNYAYKQRNATNLDRLKVYASRDCGQTWSLRKQMTGAQLSPTGNFQNSAYTPNSQSDWGYVEVTNLSLYLVPNFRYRFEFESDGGNNCFIDNINLNITYGLEDHNPAVERFTVYPNPLQDNSVVDFTLNSSEQVQIEVLDVVGKQVKALHSGRLAAGQHKMDINLAQYPAGVYFVRLTAGDQSTTRKVLAR